MQGKGATKTMWRSENITDNFKDCIYIYVWIDGHSQTCFTKSRFSILRKGLMFFFFPMHFEVVS